MLARAGVVAATITSFALVTTPMAFAGEGHHHHHDGDRGSHGGGLLNVSDIGVQVPAQVCNNSILSGVLGILSSGQSNSDSHDGKCHQKNSD